MLSTTCRLPIDNTPWQNILNFKNDTDNKGKFAGLRTWINNISKSSNSINELQDELEYKLYQYERAFLMACNTFF